MSDKDLSKEERMAVFKAGVCVGMIIMWLVIILCMIGVEIVEHWSILWN